MIEVIKDVPLKCFNDGKTYLVKAGTQFHIVERKGVFYLRYKHLYFTFVEGTVARNPRFFKSV
jgi:hypothetical protein